MIFKSIQNRILFFQISGILVINILLGVVIFHFMVERLIATEQQQLGFVVSHTEDMLLADVARKKEVLLQISQGKEVEDYFDNYRDLALVEYLAHFQQEFPQISFLDKQGYEEVAVKDGQKIDTLDEPYGRSVVDLIRAGGSQPQLIFNLRDDGSGVDCICMQISKYNYFGNEYRGTLLASVPFKTLLEKLSATHVHSAGIMALWGDGGKTIFVRSPPNGHMHGDHLDIKPVAATHRDGQVFLDIASGKDRCVTTHILGIKSIVASVYVPELRINLLATLPYSKITDQLVPLRNSIVIGILGLCILTVFLSILLARTIAKPITQLTKVTRAIAEGGNDTQGLEPIKGRQDEVGVLVDSFQTMIENLWRTTVSRNYVDSIFAAMAESVVVIAENGRIKRANPAACQLLGYSEAELVKLAIYDIFAEQANSTDFIGKLLQQDEWRETAYRRKDGSILPVLFSCSTLSGSDSEKETVCVASDISTLQKARKNLEENEEYLNAMMQSLPSGLLVIDAEKRLVIDANPAACALYQCDKDELLGRFCHKLMAPTDKNAEWPPIVTKEKPIINMECELVSPIKPCRRIPIVMSVQAVNLRGTLIYINSFVDITESKRVLNALQESEEKLRAQAITDELTGLFNRRGFMSLVEKQLLISGRNKKEVFLLYADVDNLKTVNDTLGHMAGDDLICMAAKVLKNACRESDIVGRMGGDEFAVLLIDAEDEEVIVRRIESQIKEINRGPDRQYELAISIGVVCCCEIDQDAPCLVDSLLSIADGKMYEIKKQRKEKARAVIRA